MTAARRVDFNRDHIDVHDMITELVDRHSHRETYDLETAPGAWASTTYRLGHVTDVPPLLDQLVTATPSSAGDSNDAGPGGAGGFESQPAAHLESMDALLEVDREASRLLRVAGVDDLGLSTAECVRKVGALLPSMPWCRTGAPRREHGVIVCCERHRVEAVVRTWWARARVATGWDSPAWRPDSTCPPCGRRGGLRVRLSSKVATCTECRETWDPTSIGLLAEHIRVESFTAARARRPLPCARVEGYEPPVVRRPGLGDTALVLCPACGSARCQRAVASRLDELAGAREHPLPAR